MTAADVYREQLERTWSNAPGWRGQLTAVNHSTIGLRYIVTSLAFLLAGGMLAMFMRLQLGWSDQSVLDHETYNQFVTMHGTTMMFLFAIPLLEGIALYLLPKMIGARDMPFPRLTAFGYWCYLFGGVFLYTSFAFDAAPASGWFMYTPLSSIEYTPGLGSDFWLLGITLAEVAAVGAAVEIIVAVLKNRAPGMAITQMPLFAWYLLVTAFMIVFGFPPLILGSVLLEIERAFGFAFFDPARGGDPLLWQHLFWLFGHPEVYIIFLPAAGVVSTVLPVFARRPIVAYTWIVLALIGTAFLSFGLWVHHMFTVGIPLLALSFFSAASMGVALPMGVQVFAWIATLWTGKPWLRAPMRFILGFFFIFVLGGLTGVMVALVPFDWQVHDTHFIVAHLHYVLIGGMLFPCFAAVYYWLPLLSGRLPDEGFSKVSFWLLFLGFNATFLPMHLTGLLGLPRRVYTYGEAFGPAMQWLNLVSTAAGFVFALGVVAFIVSVVLGWRHGTRAPANPWGAATLEWAMPTPPPVYNFVSIPTIASRDPLWDEPLLTERLAEGQGFLRGAPRGTREMLGTSMRAGAPELVVEISGSTWLPLGTAIALFAAIVMFMVKWYWVSGGLLLVVLALVLAWLWTTGDRLQRREIDADPLVLPTQAGSIHAPGLWGTAVFVLVSGTLLASLVFAYFYLWLDADAWPPVGQGALPMVLGGAALIALLGAGALLHWLRAAGLAAVALAVYLVCVTIALTGFEASPREHAYASVVSVLVGFHAVHAGIALIMCVFTMLRPLALRIAALFTHYVVGAGVLMLAVIYLFPAVQ
ncbi:MAG: cytochrome c oxidase subunit I [Gammaproteobacteria bacterium]